MTGVECDVHLVMSEKTKKKQDDERKLISG